MLKTARSWSKPKDIPNLIGRKKVDQSLFKYGTHIPLAFHDDFKNANKGLFVESGHSHKLELLIGDKSYDATLNNFNKKGSDQDVLHIRYDGKKELIGTLKTMLKNSYNYLQNEISKKPKGDRDLIEVPDEYAEYIDFYETGEPYKYKLVIIPSGKTVEATVNDLSDPFNKIFKNRQAANWAFDFLKESCERLKITEPNDRRFAVTFRHNKRVLRLNMGSWAVLQFYSPDYSQYSIGMALIEELTNIEGPYNSWGAFANSSPSISVYEMPIELGKPLENNIRQVYEKTFSIIGERFKNWKGCPARHAHRNDMAEAIFDISKREKLFDEGISEIIEEPAPNVWWVNQGTTLNEEKKEGIIWAPIKSSDGRSLYHWETMTEVQEGDIILHYANGSLQYVSEVIEPAIETKKPISLKGQNWDEDGRLIKAEYYKLDPGINLGKFSKEVLALNIDQGPLDVNGNVKQGYLFRFNADALQIIIKSQPETKWPEVAYFSDDLNPNYWVFQGSPNVFDVVRALKDGNVPTWSVAAHKKEIKKGDKIILWVTGKNTGCYALGTVLSGIYNDYDEENQLQYSSNQENKKQDRCKVTFNHIFVDAPILKESIKDNPILKDLKVGLQGTNFSATKEQFEELLKIAGNNKVIIDTLPTNPIYTFEDLSRNTGFDSKEIERWLKALERKKQVIIYGPPGTGKTYIAEQISRHLIGGTDGFSEIIQFHPAYAYEDFMQGIRPKAGENGQLDFSMVEGRFLQFSDKAKSRKGRCVLIIDEINRANLARVFGELMYLLEYRDRPIPLAAGGTFQIPDNVRIIGTMNTADRSIALVDHALRRRFAFLALYPNYGILLRYHQQSAFKVELLINLLEKLNRQIADRHYEVGISFFLRKDLADQIEDIWRLEIEPYLEEYFFDQPDKVETFRWDKISKEIEL